MTAGDGVRDLIGQALDTLQDDEDTAWMMLTMAMVSLSQVITSAA